MDCHVINPKGVLGVHLKPIVYGTKQQEVAMREDDYLCMDERTEIW